MSYDIYLFKKLENKTVLESAETVLESGINALDSGTFKLQRKALSEKLKGLNPKFKKYNRENHLELVSNETGIRVAVYPNQIAVTAPYWHKGKEAEKVFTEIFNYLSIIKEETGYCIYNPQSGDEMIINQGAKNFLQTYLGVSRHFNN